MLIFQLDFFFFATKVDEFLICCRYQPFIRGVFFSSSVGCLFVWLIVSDVQKLHSWAQSPFSIFALVACVVQNNFANITSRSFYLAVLFSPLSCLSLNSNLELIHEWCEIGVPFGFSCMWPSSFPNTVYLRNCLSPLSLFWLSPWHSHQILVDSVFEGLYLGSWFCLIGLLIYLSVSECSVMSDSLQHCGL